MPRTGLVEQLRAVKDEGELELFRQACAITDRMFERLVSEVRFVGRPERDVAWDITRLYHEEGASDAVVRGDRRLRLDRRTAARACRRQDHRDRRARRDRHRLRRRRLRLRLHADPRHRRARRRDARRPTTSCSPRSRRGSTRSGAGVTGVDADAAARGRDREQRLRRHVRPWPRTRSRARRPRGAAALDREHRHARGRQRRHGRAGRLSPRAASASGSRTT